MHPFEQFLKRHRLEALAVSVEAEVRYATVWNATRGNPITLDHAYRIREAVVNLTGLAYTDSLVIRQEQPVDQPSLLPIKKIPRSPYQRERNRH